MSETKIKYVTATWGTDIKRLEITRETAKFVWHIRMEYNGDAERKMAKGENVHNSYADARAFLIARAMKELDRVHMALSRTEAALARAYAIPESEPESAELPAEGELRL